MRYLLILLISFNVLAQMDYETGEKHYNYQEGECFKHLLEDKFFHLTQVKATDLYGYKVVYKKNIFTDEPLLEDNQKIWTTGEFLTIEKETLRMNYRKTTCINLF